MLKDEHKVNFCVYLNISCIC